MAGYAPAALRVMGWGSEMRPHPVKMKGVRVMHNAIPFQKKNQESKIAKESLSFLMDEEIDEAISILFGIKKEKNEEKRIDLEHEFYELIQNAWHREMEDIINE